MLSSKIIRAAAICCPDAYVAENSEINAHNLEFWGEDCITCRCAEDAFERELNAALEEMLSEDGFYSSSDNKEQSPPMEDLPF